MNGFTIDAGSFGNFEYGLHGRENSISFGSPDVAEYCDPNPSPLYHGTSIYERVPTSWYNYGYYTGGGTPIWFDQWAPSSWGWAFVGNMQAFWECEQNTFSPYYNLPYEDVWSSLTLDIVLDGNPYSYDLGQMINGNLYQWGDTNGNGNLVGGIRIEYEGIEFQTIGDQQYGSGTYIGGSYVSSTTLGDHGSTDGNHAYLQSLTPGAGWTSVGGTCTPSPCWYVSPSGTTPIVVDGIHYNSGTTPPSQYQGLQTSMNPGGQGPHGEYTGDLLVTVYFDEAFGQIPPGSSLEIITDPAGHVLAYRWNTPYGNSGLISGDPYLDKYDEPNARIRFRDSSIVEGGISTFMKTFDYQSGVGGCKDC
jgi:hypothetical protein